MEIQRATPPAYVAHSPADLNLPSVPRTEVSHEHAHAQITLPDLKTVLSPEFQEISRPSNSRTRPHDSPNSVRSLPRIDPGPQYGNGATRSTELAIASPSETGSIMSVDDGPVRSTSVSMDDPDVRIAAEALSGLGNPGMLST